MCLKRGNEIERKERRGKGRKREEEERIGNKGGRGREKRK